MVLVVYVICEQALTYNQNILISPLKPIHASVQNGLNAEQHLKKVRIQELDVHPVAHNCLPVT